MSIWEYKPTNRKCLEGKKVFAAYFDGELVGYRFKTPMQTIRKIQRVYKKLGVPRWNEATLYNGWYFHEGRNIYINYKDGKAVDKKTQIKGMPMGYVS